jgi:hypothetical protein
VEVSKIIERANEIMRRQYVQRMRQMNATGWDNKTTADVQHLEIADLHLCSVAQAVEEALDAHAKRFEAYVSRRSALRATGR